MPGGDRTGPAGLGPRTGRGLGYCSGYDSPGYTKGPGGGIAWGFGRGANYPYGREMAWRRGGRRWAGAGGYVRGGRAGLFYAGPIETTPEQRLDALKQEKEFLESELKGLQRAIEDVSKNIEDLEKSD